MSEIEKMYENCGVKNYRLENWCGLVPDGWKIIPEDNDENKVKEIVRDFTAEKQLAIFKMFCKRYLEVSQHVEENGDLCFGIKATVGDYAVGFNKDFAECLADFVNSLWQDLTEEEKQQIKEILE